MMHSIEVVTPAKSQALVTVPEAKLALNLSRSVDPVVEEQIAMFIDWSSGEIAAMAGRVFGEETVIETVYDADPTYPYRVWLSRWPVSSIQSLTCEGVDLDPLDYELEKATGKITRFDSNFGSGPVIVAYTGGYKLPADSPMALRQAVLLMTREAYNASTRGDSTIRMIGHKESRVIYFDPNARATAGGGGAAGSPAKRAAQDLVKHFMRFYV